MPIRAMPSENEIVERLDRLEKRLDEIAQDLDEQFRLLRHDLSTEFKIVRGEVPPPPMYR